MGRPCQLEEQSRLYLTRRRPDGEADPQGDGPAQLRWPRAYVLLSLHSVVAQRAIVDHVGNPRVVRGVRAFRSPHTVVVQRSLGWNHSGAGAGVGMAGASGDARPAWRMWCRPPSSLRAHARPALRATSYRPHRAAVRIRRRDRVPEPGQSPLQLPVIMQGCTQCRGLGSVLQARTRTSLPTCRGHHNTEPRSRISSCVLVCAGCVASLTSCNGTNNK